jgi:hypothetical protein
MGVFLFKVERLRFIILSKRLGKQEEKKDNQAFK